LLTGGNEQRVLYRLRRRGDHSWVDATAKLASAKRLLLGLLDSGPAAGPCENDLIALEGVFGVDFDLDSVLAGLVSSVSLQDSENNDSMYSSVFPGMSPVLAAKWNSMGFTVGAYFKNSNSFTYTLLYDIGLSALFGPLVSNAPGWGMLVPGLN
jgi:hypothetical protein